MKNEPFMYVRVPASTANLGPGFDSFGLALAKYMVITVSHATEWKVHYEQEEFQSLPSNKDNFINQMIIDVANKENITVPPLSLNISSAIPLARGLGSSASAIVAAVEIATYFSERSYTKKEKLSLAYSYESHIDNIGASLFGGFIVGGMVNEEIVYKNLAFPSCDIIAVIPNYELSTNYARSVLPNQFSRSQAVECSNVANILLAALLTNDWETIGKMMMADKFHQPYRASLIQEYEVLSSKKEELGVYGVTISGAGPTVLLFCPKGESYRIMPFVKAECSNANVELVSIAEFGVEISETNFWRK